MGYIKEIKIGSGTANLIEPILYGTTNTAAGTQAKVVSISNFELITGVTIAVKFTVTNTHATPQLNVNSTGAKSIKYRGEDLPSAATLTANRVYQFVYDGTNWELIGDLDTNTWRGIQDNLTSSTNTTDSLSAKQGYLLANGSARDNTKVSKSGDETVAGNKTFSGITTLSAASVYPSSQNTILTPNSGAIIQSPIPKYLWHDIIAFCRATTPTYYTTTDGSTWTESTLEKRLFAHMNAWGNQQVINSSISGSRWIWHGGGFAYSGITWIILGITYSATIATFDLLLETTSDATAASPTWTTICNVTNVKYNQQPIWIKSNTTSTNDFRLTITRSSGDSTTTVLPICAIEFLTTRWGDQGKGNEFEFPYQWNGTPDIYPLKNNTSTLGSSSLKWSNVYATTFTGNLTGNAATATKATQDADGNTISSTYLKLSGGTMTGALNTANSVWNKIGDDIQIGDINEAGTLGIQGLNGNTSIRFTTYNQTTKTTGGKISWDGTKFSITSTTAINASISGSAGSVALSGVTGADDLKAIEALSGTSGFLKKTAANTWTLDTTAYTTNTGTVTSVAASGSNGISISGSPITTSGTIAIGLNLSTAINGLGEGSSQATGEDYLVAQYAGGGTTTTTYHRRKVSNVVNATVVKAALSTNATHSNQFLRKDGTWQTPPYPVTSVAGNTGAITADTLRTSLGLSNAMHFIGTTTTTMSDGLTTANVTINNATHTPSNGDVVLYSDTEYVWTGSAWERLGRDSSWALDNAVIHNTLTSTKGDMIYASAANTPARLAIGTAGYFLKATANGPVWANTTDITTLGTITTGTWNATVIGATYGGTGKTSLKDSANALINALDTGSSDLTAGDYVITQYVGGGTATITYHRRPANKVINATLVKTALGTNSSTTDQWLNKKGEWSTPTATNIGLGNVTNDAQIPKSVFTEAYQILYSTGSATYTVLTANKSTTKKFLRMTGVSASAGAAPAWDTVTSTDVGLGNVSNNSSLNNATGSKGDIIYWSAANTPAHLTNTNSTTKQALTITSQAPSWVNISPSITITAGDSSNAPKVNVTVLGVSGTAQSITTASTSVYGVIKLQDGVSSTSTALAATANAAYTASRSSLHTPDATTKYYITGTTSNATNTGGDTFDTGIYATTTAGELSALKYSIHDTSATPVEKVRMEWNSTDQSLDFIFT